MKHSRLFSLVLLSVMFTSILPIRAEVETSDRAFYLDLTSKIQASEDSVYIIVSEAIPGLSLDQLNVVATVVADSLQSKNINESLPEIATLLVKEAYNAKGDIDAKARTASNIILTLVRALPASETKLINSLTIKAVLSEIHPIYTAKVYSLTILGLELMGITMHNLAIIEQGVLNGLDTDGIKKEILFGLTHPSHNKNNTSVGAIIPPESNIYNN